jgi:arginine N-succinyltransferase
MFVIRDAHKSDLDGLHKLASVLDSVNLPNNRDALEEIIDQSVKSFTSKIKNPLEREYLFVLEDTRNARLVGTSMIIAQHGTKDAPHIYLDVTTREHYSASLDKLFKHQILSIGYHYEGHTEIGGLVVDPEYRGQDKPGKQLSFIRFLFLAMHKKLFRDRVLAELLPPLLPDGRSQLWEHFGRKFTGLEYQEADKLSRENKEFIQQLGPQTDVYATFFPDKVRATIGKVGPNTEPVKNMLEKIGFKYTERIDPFDGGPHFEANVADITVVQRYRRAKVAEAPLDRQAEEWLVCFERTSNKNRMCAVKTPLVITDDEAHLPQATREALGVKPGDKVHAIPFDS